ncbi:MAG: transglycosylase SLT domain-containing protein [Bacteroidia bacterium]|nr:transglycosylase SLT domain-containing protein [Bacteroidia bacterium]
MKRSIIISLLFFLTNYFVGISQHSAGEPIIPENTAVAEIMDSLLADYEMQFFYKTRQDSVNQNRFGFAPDYIPRYSQAETAQRIKELCTVFPLEYNAHVQAFIDMYTVRKRELTSRLLGLQYVYFPIIEPILDQMGIPLELKYLCVIESAFNPYARSRAAAVGLWQFIIGTGKQYGLRIDSYIDERCDPYKASIAAAKYLKNLYSIYNDWPLVIAAYNCGPGTINRAIRYAGGKVNYWHIQRYLPIETQAYVPAFIAATYIMNYAAEHNLYPVWTDLAFPQEFISVSNQKVSLDQLASRFNCDSRVLKLMNPEYKTGVVPYATAPFKVRVTDKIADWVKLHPEALENITSTEPSTYSTYQPKYNPVPVPVVVSHTSPPPSSAPNPTNSYENIPVGSKLIYHTVATGESIGQIADRYHVEIGNIINWNSIQNYYIQPGQSLKVYIPVNQQYASNTANPAVKAYPAAPVKTAAKGARYHKVQYGESLWSITTLYKTIGLSIDKICSYNKITPQTKLKVGQFLIIQL